MSLFVMCDYCGKTQSFNPDDSPGNWRAMTIDGAEVHSCSDMCRSIPERDLIVIRQKVKWPM